MTADTSWSSILTQSYRDLAPFPGRFDLTWRIALLCALVTAAAMIYKIPEPAISCYLIIFLMRPDAGECVAKAIGLIGLASIVVLLMVPLINATIDFPLWQVLSMTVAAFVFLYLSSASQLGEIGAIIGLVIAFILTLVGDAPTGGVATQGLIYAWKMAVMPMAVMIVFLLILGRGPHTLLREAIAKRLEISAVALEGTGDTEETRLQEELCKGNSELEQKILLTRIFHLVPGKRSNWLSGAIQTSYRLMLAIAALPADTAEDSDRTGDKEDKRALAAACRASAEAVKADRVPASIERPETNTSPETDARSTDPAWAALASLSASNGGSESRPPKIPFLKPDAFTNPDHQRYALKTTAAAILCYLIYTGIGWQGIHTAMITCFVVALGSVGETVHKLALRIIGCLLGAAMGVASILFIIPSLGSIGGLMALVFAGVLIAGWVAAGPERTSYAGVQIGLAFLLTILNGFAPSTDMDSAGDRIAGILLGNVVIYLIFMEVWPKSAMVAVRENVSAALTTLSQIAAYPPATRQEAVHKAAEAETCLGKAADTLFTVPFESYRIRPENADIKNLSLLIDETIRLVPKVIYSTKDTTEAGDHLSNCAKLVAEDTPSSPATSSNVYSASGRSAGGRSHDDATLLIRRTRNLIVD